MEGFEFWCDDGSESLWHVGGQEPGDLTVGVVVGSEQELG